MLFLRSGPAVWLITHSMQHFWLSRSAVFSDGSFCYIPKDTTCPMEISTYFRINNRAGLHVNVSAIVVLEIEHTDLRKDSGQFERTLLIAEENSYVSYLEGCTVRASASSCYTSILPASQAPMFDSKQLHAGRPSAAESTPLLRIALSGIHTDLRWVSS